MLSTFRKHSSGIVVKLLMGLLVFTFILWGVGDMIRKQNKSVAFKVASREFSDYEWHKLFNRYLGKIENNFDHKFSKEEIKTNHLEQLILNQAINDILLQHETKNYGLLISDNMVKHEIASQPAFQTNGKFDKALFDQLLRNMNISEAEFITHVKESLSDRFFTFALTSNRDVPKFYLNLLSRAQNAVRDVAILNLPLTMKIDTPNKPTEEQLKEIYTSKLNGFTIPEKRNITFFSFNLDNVNVTNISQSDEELKQQYEEKKFIFTEPEKRKVSQLYFKNEQDARKAQEQLKKGSGFALVGKQFFPDKKDFSMGEITSMGLEKEVADSIFQALPGQITTIVKSSLGYHIFKIDSVIPPKIRSFEESKDKLKKMYMEEKKFEALSKLAQEIDQSIASGKKLEDIANMHNLKVEHIENITPKTDHPLMKIESFKNVVFSTSEDSLSSVTPLLGQDSYFVVQVDKVIPQVTKSFEQVRSELEKIWDSEKTKYALHEKASSIVLDYNKNKSSINSLSDIKALCKKLGIQSPKIIKISTSTDNLTYPKELLNQLKTIQKGDISRPIFDKKSGYYIGIVYGIDVPQNSDSKANNLLTSLYQAIPGEIIDQFFAKLRTKYNVEINYEIVNRVIE
jgi:peptidyl-prolyl cis-trans isomerase D